MASVTCECDGGVIVGPDVALATLLGAGGPEDLVGRPLADFVYPEDRVSLETALGYTMGRSELSIRLAGGGPARVLLQRTGMFAVRIELLPEFEFSLPVEPTAQSLWIEPTLFSRWLASEIERAHRYDSPLSALRLEIPGTANPDPVMREVCRALPEVLRACDAVSQLGRRLVVALMPSTSHDGAEVVVSRLRAAMTTALPAPAVAQWMRGTNPRTFHAWLLDGDTTLHAA